MFLCILQSEYIKIKGVSYAVSGKRNKRNSGNGALLYFQ